MVGLINHKTIIIDNAFDGSLIENTLKKLGKNNNSEIWCDLNSKHEYEILCKSLLNECSKYYNLDLCLGYEFWTQNNSRPTDWHYDKDEQLWETTGNYKFPICSIVFYLKVNNLVGGLLHLGDTIITPKTNRMIIFPPAVFHYVEEFEGERISFLLNPWDYNISLGTTIN